MLQVGKQGVSDTVKVGLADDVYDLGIDASREGGVVPGSDAVATARTVKSERCDVAGDTRNERDGGDAGFIGLLVSTRRNLYVLYGLELYACGGGQHGLCGHGDQSLCVVREFDGATSLHTADGSAAGGGHSASVGGRIFQSMSRDGMRVQVGSFDLG